VNGFLFNDLLEANGDALGCMEMDACNYDDNASINGNCEYPGEGLNCEGNPLSTEQPILIEFEISSAYPNPFNPVVNIDLSIDIAEHLQLSVFTIEGIQIKTIYNGRSVVGESTFTWRPENRASGFYFISAVIDDQVKTQKVLFLK